MIAAKESKVTHSVNDENNPKIITTNSEVLNEPESPTISKFREQNPNLQPLSKEEINNLKTKGRHSIQALPTVQSVTSSDSLSRQHSFNSKDFRSKISRKSFLRSGEKRSVKTSTPDTQTFWKYHVLEFGNGLYLTTNPDAKHMYCRNAPGFHVEIMYPNNSRGRVDKSGKSGFRLVFKNEIDGDVFLTVTKNSQGFDVDMVRRFYENKEGNLAAASGEVKGNHLHASEIEVDELKRRYFESTLNPFRYQLFDFNDKKWFLGSIPQFKTATKLKNKRFIFFHEPKRERILSCFRPQEIRTKKKLLKKFNRSVQSSSNSFFYNDEDTSESGLSSRYDSVYYAPGDGVFKEDPPDDSPNNEKLGWITMYDDFEIFKQPGMWELTLSLTLAAGFSKILEENYSDDK